MSSNNRKIKNKENMKKQSNHTQVNNEQPAEKDKVRSKHKV